VGAYREGITRGHSRSLPGGRLSFSSKSPDKYSSTDC